MELAAGNERGRSRGRGRGQRSSNDPMDMDHQDGGLNSTARAMENMAAAIAMQTAAITAQNQQTSENKHLSAFRRQNPSQFEGNEDPEKADRWIQELEKIFELVHTPEENKIKYAVFQLTGDAEYWWRGTRQLLEAGQRPITWGTFKEAFLDKYFPESVRIEKEQEFLRFQQDNMTIGEYAAKFESLAKYFRFFQAQPDEKWKCEKFEAGLRYDIKESVLPLQIRKFQALVEMCRKIEQMKKERNNKSNIGGPFRSKDQNWKGKQIQKKPYFRSPRNNQNHQPYHGNATALGNQKAMNPTQDPKCFKCGKQGHLMGECPIKGIKCFNCNRMGHMARECTAPRRQPAINNMEINRPATHGRVYTLNGAEAANSDDLIRGKCEIADKSLTVLFDSGATHSFISFDCVKLLKIPISSMPCDLIVSTPTSKSVVVNTICLNCPIVIQNKSFQVDLICLPLVHLDIILGMDWLSANHILMDCAHKI